MHALTSYTKYTRIPYLFPLYEYQNEICSEYDDDQYPNNNCIGI